MGSFRKILARIKF